MGLVIGYGVWHEGDTIEKVLVVSVGEDKYENSHDGTLNSSSRFSLCMY